MKYIASIDIRKYLKTIGKEFTDTEKATLICNSRNTYEYVMTELRNIMENTEDVLLKTQIKERIAYEEAVKDTFMNPSDKSVYVLETDEGKRYEENGFFATVKAATDFAGTLNKRFIIKKKKVLAEGDPIGDDEFVYNELGSAKYDEMGQLYCCSSCEVEESKYLNGDYNSRFENLFVFIPHPFRRGDIIKCVNLDIYGIVSEPQTEKEMYEVEESRKKKNFGDVTDMNISIVSLDDNGDFVHDYVPIDCIEFAKLEADNPAKELLEEAGELMLGKGCIPCLQEIQEEYRFFISKKL